MVQSLGPSGGAPFANGNLSLILAENTGGTSSNAVIAGLRA